MRILLLLFFITCFQIPSFAQNKVTLTNDDFPKSSINSREQSLSVNETNNNNNTNTNTTDNINNSLHKTYDLRLQYQLSDLMLAAAENPNDQNLQAQIAEVKNKMEATSVSVSNEDLLNIYWRTQLVSRKIAIIKLEKRIKSHQEQIANAEPYQPNMHAALEYFQKEKEQLQKLYEDYEESLEHARKEGANSRVIP